MYHRFSPIYGNRVGPGRQNANAIYNTHPIHFSSVPGLFGGSRVQIIIQTCPKAFEQSIQTLVGHPMFILYIVFTCIVYTGCRT